MLVCPKPTAKEKAACSSNLCSQSLFFFFSLLRASSRGRSDKVSLKSASLSLGHGGGQRWERVSGSKHRTRVRTIVKQERERKRKIVTWAYKSSSSWRKVSGKVQDNAFVLLSPLSLSQDAEYRRRSVRSFTGLSQGQVRPAVNVRVCVAAAAAVACYMCVFMHAIVSDVDAVIFAYARCC